MNTAMKKLLFLLLGTVVSLPSFTRDFSYTYEGKTLVYTVTDEDAKTCEVKAGSPGEAGNEVAGVLEIPSNVYEGGG